MDALYALEGGTAKDVRSHLPDPPSENAIRTLLQILEEKGQVGRKRVGRQNVFSPQVERQRAGQRALGHVVDTFFGGSMGAAIAAHFTGKDSQLDSATYERLKAVLDEAEQSENKREEGDKK